MGARLWRLVEEFQDSQTFRPSVRAIARQAGIPGSTFANWQTITSLPERQYLDAFARISPYSYRQLLEAALADAGYGDGSDAASAGRPAPPSGAAARRTGRKSVGQQAREIQDRDAERA